MPNDKQSFLAELQSRVVELIRTTPAADIERNVKALLAQAFQRLDLVTRDEFELSAKLIEQLGERVKALEESVSTLDHARAAGADSTAPGNGQ